MYALVGSPVGCPPITVIAPLRAQSRRRCDETETGSRPVRARPCSPLAEHNPPQGRAPVAETRWGVACPVVLAVHVPDLGIRGSRCSLATPPTGVGLVSRRGVLGAASAPARVLGSNTRSPRLWVEWQRRFDIVGFSIGLRRRGSSLSCAPAVVGPSPLPRESSSSLEPPLHPSSKRHCVL